MARLIDAAPYALRHGVFLSSLELKEAWQTMSDRADSEYTHSQDDAWDEMMQRRTAASEAAFLLPFIREGMSILDVGCGQGTITADLAALVRSGRVCGFDPQSGHIERAQRFVQARGLTNLDFRVGDIYDSPFRGEAFDMAFSHMVFMHLSDPEEALRCVVEMVKPGGLIATRDRGSSFHIEGPYAEELARVVQIVAATTNAVSGSRYGHSIGEVMHRLCREAGLELLQLTADLEIQSAASRTYVLAGPSGQRAIQCGVTTREELDQLARYWEAWAADPDAYLALDHYEVVARKPTTDSH